MSKDLDTSWSDVFVDVSLDGNLNSSTGLGPTRGVRDEFSGDLSSRGL